MPSPATWCSWLNGIGCVRVMPLRVVYPARSTIMKTPSSAAATKTADKIEIFESVFVLRWKIWDIHPIPSLNGTCDGLHPRQLSPRHDVDMANPLDLEATEYTLHGRANKTEKLMRVGPP